MTTRRRPTGPKPRPSRDRAWWDEQAKHLLTFLNRAPATWVQIYAWAKGYGHTDTHTQNLVAHLDITGQICNLHKAPNPPYWGPAGEDADGT